MRPSRNEELCKKIKTCMSTTTLHPITRQYGCINPSLLSLTCFHSLIYSELVCDYSSNNMEGASFVCAFRPSLLISMSVSPYALTWQFYHINRFSVEDVSDLWPTVRKGFEERLPFKRASLNNKTRNSVLVEKLSAEFILTTDARLRSRFPQEQLLFWFREPYATVVLVSCEVYWNLFALISVSWMWLLGIAILAFLLASDSSVYL